MELTLSQNGQLIMYIMYVTQHIPHLDNDTKFIFLIKLCFKKKKACALFMALPDFKHEKNELPSVPQN